MSPVQGPAGTTVRIEITESAGRAVATGDTVRLLLPEQAAASASLAFTTYTAMERARQEQGMVTVHATAVTRDHAAVVLLGDKAMGKTSTSLALGRRGWTHAGDDLVVIREDAGRLDVMPGKPTAAVRLHDGAAFYEPKPALDLRDGFASGPTAAALFVRLAVHPDARPHATAAVPFSGNEMLRLHENLSRYISGLPTPLSGLGGAPCGRVWQIDSTACARWRAHLISVMEKHPFFYVYAPTAEAAADLIEGLMP
ncbi:hypothetical protein [Streptomyces sp. NPDC001389]|uniref:hypothetical protein n=1 Tax=Streptomyces sp. NPDC001389 TaxID=3364569 RepID=UPI0036AAE891